MMSMSTILPALVLLIPLVIFGQPNIVPGINQPNQMPQNCPGNETYTMCATRCEPQCNVTPGPCVLICDPPKCQCTLGYQRNQNGRCVQPADCSPPGQQQQNTGQQPNIGQPQQNNNGQM